MGKRTGRHMLTCAHYCTPWSWLSWRVHWDKRLDDLELPAQRRRYVGATGYDKEPDDWDTRQRRERPFSCSLVIGTPWGTMYLTLVLRKV